jgi:membrane-bound ClpP family serine protease
MAEWITVIGLILVGIFLVVAEVIFIPGIFVAGAIGAGISIYGVYLSYDYFGDDTGVIVLIAAVIGNILGLVLALRGKSWERFSLKQTHNSRVNDQYDYNLQVGDKGVTTSSLKPIGKALFNDDIIEVRSNGNFVKENIAIKILAIESGKIIVEPL